MNKYCVRFILTRTLSCIHQLKMERNVTKRKQNMKNFGKLVCKEVTRPDTITLQKGGFRLPNVSRVTRIAVVYNEF